MCMYADTVRTLIIMYIGGKQAKILFKRKSSRKLREKFHSPFHSLNHRTHDVVIILDSYSVSFHRSTLTDRKRESREEDNVWLKLI